jgi:DNA replication protein DnaD
MSTLQEIEAAVPKLSPREIAELRAWLDEFCEDQLEVSDAVKAELDEAHRDIEAGRFRTRQPS